MSLDKTIKNDVIQQIKKHPKIIYLVVINNERTSK